jgi:hypothetical protein
MAVVFAASSALAQTGLSTVRLTDQQDGFARDGFVGDGFAGDGFAGDGFAGAVTGPAHLSHLDSQPHLERHLTRINQFRTMFRTSDGRSSEQPDSRPARVWPALVSAQAAVVPRSGPVAAPDVADLAILELEESMSTRQYPSRVYPGVGLVVALKTISTWSEQSMIRALRTGARPIYNQSGDVIGVEDADTGLLLGGRRG